MTENHSRPARLVVVIHPEPVCTDRVADLLRADGLTLQIEADAVAALDAMVRSQPDLVVSGLHMPGIDGWRLCRLLRSAEYRTLNRVPILLLSGTYAEEETARIAADLGVDAVLPWPAGEARLGAAVQTLLRGERDRSALRALVVEDDEDLGRLIERSLASHPYEVVRVTSARAAEEAVVRQGFDIAVVDFHLPDRGGDSLLDTLGHAQPDCACVMITGDMAPGLAVEWMRRGAAAYLRKPFEMEYLLELCARARRERTLLRAEEMLRGRTQALRESEAKCRDIFDQAGEMIFLYDRNGYFRDANRAACAQTGYSRDELLSLRVGDIDPDSDERGDRDPFGAEAPASDRPVTIQVRHRRKDGTEYPAEITASRIRIGGEEYVLGIGRDITERLRADEEKARQIEELRRWQTATLGREMRILELKHEINELLARTGEQPRYASAESP